MFFKKKEKRNTIKDDELNYKEPTQNIFNKSTQKFPKQYNTPIDFNQKYIKYNRENTLLSKILDLIIIGIVVYLLLILVPKLIKYYETKEEKLITQSKEMVEIVKKYHKEIKCNTTISNRYYFNITNSKQIFDKKYESPFIKTKMSGYIEINTSEDVPKYYITLSDGIFGYDRVEINELTKKDIGIYTYLNQKYYEPMTCEKEFAFYK